MICLLLLLTTVSIIVTDAIPVERHALPYYEYPEEVPGNYKTHNNYNRPRASYERRPHTQSYHSKRDESKPPANQDDLIVNTQYVDPRRTNLSSEVTPPSPDDEPSKDNYYDDDWPYVKKKSSPKSQRPRLYEKLTALGLEYSEAVNLMRALRHKLKVDGENI